MELIASNVLSSNLNSITFSSIPGTYRDLVLVADVIGNSGNDAMNFRFNADTGNNYSRVFMEGNGTTASSSSGTSNALQDCSGNIMVFNTSSIRGQVILNIFDYAQSKHKTCLVRVGANGGVGVGTGATAGRWANTSAITSITILVSTGNLMGSTSSFYLYGIVS